MKMEQVNRFSFALILILLGQLAYSCANQIIYDNKETLATPTKLKVLPLPQKTFRLQYEVENEEATFIGYNVYVSTASISDSDINTLLPVTENGNIPTASHQKDEKGQSKQLTVKSYREENGSFVIPMKFKVGKTYYFRICAYSRLGKRSTPSPEASAVALP